MYVPKTHLRIKHDSQKSSYMSASIDNNNYTVLSPLGERTFRYASIASDSSLSRSFAQELLAGFNVSVLVGGCTKSGKSAFTTECMSDVLDTLHAQIGDDAQISATAFELNRGFVKDLVGPATTISDLQSTILTSRSKTLWLTQVLLSNSDF